MREFSDGGGNGKPGTRGENKVLYDDFVDMLVVASPRCASPCWRTNERSQQDPVGFVCVSFLSIWRVCVHQSRMGKRDSCFVPALSLSNYCSL